LVAGDLEAGRTVIEELEQRGITVDVAAWLQDDDTGTWRLLISTPTGDQTGSRPVYAAIQDLLGGLNISNLDLSAFLVASPHEHLVKDLKRRVGTDNGFHENELRLDLLGLGGRSYRSSRIYRVIGDAIGNSARVRVRATGQLGTVRGVINTPSGPRYLVLYDITDDDLRSMRGKPAPMVGADFGAQDLDFLYVVQTGGWPQRIPEWLINATGATTLTDSAVVTRLDQE